VGCTAIRMPGEEVIRGQGQRSEVRIADSTFDIAHMPSVLLGMEHGAWGKRCDRLDGSYLIDLNDLNGFYDFCDLLLTV